MGLTPVMAPNYIDPTPGARDGVSAMLPVAASKPNAAMLDSRIGAWL
jgi:hypothetical protein